MKPIMVCYLKGSTHEQKEDQLQRLKSIPGLSDDYYILIVAGSSEPKVEVFFENGGTKLDKEKLEYLLSVCK